MRYAKLVSELPRKLNSLRTRFYIKIHERKYNGLPYLYQNNGYDSILIVFSGFTGMHRRYNYVKSFLPLKCDKLYILDPWGYMGSYYLFEDGEDYPMNKTNSLISWVVNRGGYKHVYTAGTSKGGTCAIYYGLTFGVDEIFSGACQYNLGTYLWREEFRNIFYGMMGKGAGQKEVDLLNDIVKAKVREAEQCKTKVHVFYSKKELTYERQIIDLLHDLKEYHVPYEDVESDFERHEDVAYPFVNYVNYYLNNKLVR